MSMSVITPPPPAPAPATKDGGFNDPVWQRWFSSAGSWFRFLQASLYGANVKNYGAKGDGVTDDTAAFNAAIAASGLVLVPNGTYILLNVALQSNTRIQGEGWGAILRQKSTAVDGDFVLAANRSDGGTTVPTANMSGIKVQDVMLDGPALVPVFSQFRHLMLLSAVSDVVVERVKFRGFRGDGLYIGSGDSGTAERHNENITVRDCFFDGVNKENRNCISVIDCDGLNIVGNRFKNSTKSTMPGAIDIEPGSPVYPRVRGVVIRDNKFFNIGGNSACIGIVLEAAYTVQPSGFVIEDNYLSLVVTGFNYERLIAGGIQASDADCGVTLKDNYMTAFTRPFTLFNPKGLLMEGNQFISGLSSGLVSYITANDNAIDVSIRDNLFSLIGATDARGMQFFTCDRVLVEGNTFNDCGNGGGGSYAIDFNTGTSSNISLINNDFVTPTGKTVVAVQKEAAHTFTTAGNQCYGNRFNGLANNFSFVDSIGASIFYTFTPVMGGTTGDGASTYTTQSGHYTKVGRLVTYWFEIVTTATTASGEYEVSIPIDAAVTGPLNQFACGAGTLVAGVAGASYIGSVTVMLNAAADVGGLPSAGGGAIRLRTAADDGIVPEPVTEIRGYCTYMSRT